MDEQEKKPKKPRKGQFGSGEANRRGLGGQVIAPENILLTAIEDGNITEQTLLDTLKKMFLFGEVDEADVLRLLRRATRPENSYVTESNLVTAVQWIKELEAKNRAAKVLKQDAPQPTSIPTGVPELLAERAAIIEGRLPVAPVVTQKPAPIVTEKPVKPIDERSEWFKQMIGVGTTWEWKIPEPVVETIRPPNQYEKVVLPDIVDGYNPSLQGEGVTLTAAPAGSFREGFEKHKNISFEKTDHVGNSIIGNVTVKSPGIPAKLFPKIRQSYFKLWQDHKYEPKYAPDNMREDYRMFLQSLDSVILPTGQNTTPTLDGAGHESKLAVKVEYPRGVKARRWGTAIDDARKNGPRHVYGESLGTDLAQMYVDMDKIKGFDL